MALITCPECGQQVSSLAEKCPHCGSPINITTIRESDAPTTTRIKKKKWPVWKWIVAVAGGIICLIGLFFTVALVVALVGGNDENGNTAIEQTMTEIAAEEIPTEQTEQVELGQSSLSSFKHRINGTIWISLDGCQKFEIYNGYVSTYLNYGGTWLPVESASSQYSISDDMNAVYVIFGTGDSRGNIAFYKNTNAIVYREGEGPHSPIISELRAANY